MYISRIVVRNFRSFEFLDVSLNAGTTCVIGENNAGKTNLLHAIRLCIDSSLSSTYRSLAPNDIHSAVELTDPTQVLVGLEIADFEGDINEEALVSEWQHKPGVARLFYRYRPRSAAREQLESEDSDALLLGPDDYHWEISGGGDANIDLADIEWDQNVGTSVRFADLQSFLVVFLPALRDVESDLRQFRGSPLARLIDAMDIQDEDRQKLLDALRAANDEIKAADTVEQIADAIDASLANVAGAAFQMDVDIGLAEPSFQSIVRSLRILLSNTAMTDFEPSSNGLGLNNILYVSILIEYFHKRIAQRKTAGQIVLFEEPEAHLHPQLQVTLFRSLSALPFQSILTTHSTHITANAPLNSYVVLSLTGEPGSASGTPAVQLASRKVLDIERYLDATRSGLLFARKAILVEGPAELFLIPALLRSARKIDLDREGVAVIPIYGVHFDVYSKLFGSDALPKKCAIIADGDLRPSDIGELDDAEDELWIAPDFDHLESEFVRSFRCSTTFERALVMRGTLRMLASTASEAGAPRVADRLTALHEHITADTLDPSVAKSQMADARRSVLNTAKRVGKARFAQLAARNAPLATSVPRYINDAVDWLLSS